MSEIASANPVEPRQRIHFGIRHVFYAIALLASAMALDPSFVFFAVAILLGWWCVFQIRDGCLVGAGVLIVTSLVVTFPNSVRSTPTRTYCMNNIRQLCLAILNFESEHGCLPADRIVTLPDGTELRHSWRILLLPYLDYPNLYAQYDFNEAWDGPNNSALLDQMPSVFECPFVNGRKAGVTTYKLVQGPGTAFDPHKRIALTDIADGISRTIAIVEDNLNHVDWRQPDATMTPKAAASLLNSVDHGGHAHTRETPFRKAFLGGCVGFIDASAKLWVLGSTPVLPGHFLINDGVQFDVEHRAPNSRLQETKYAGYVALTMFILFAVLPFVKLWKLRMVSDGK